jgi:hypothetical protein
MVQRRDMRLFAHLQAIRWGQSSWLRTKLSPERAESQIEELKKIKIGVPPEVFVRATAEWLGDPSLIEAYEELLPPYPIPRGTMFVYRRGVLHMALPGLLHDMIEADDYPDYWRSNEDRVMQLCRTCLVMSYEERMKAIEEACEEQGGEFGAAQPGSWDDAEDSGAAHVAPRAVWATEESAGADASLFGGARMRSDSPAFGARSRAESDDSRPPSPAYSPTHPHEIYATMGAPVPPQSPEYAPRTPSPPPVPDPPRSTGFAEAHESSGPLIGAASGGVLYQPHAVWGEAWKPQ